MTKRDLAFDALHESVVSIIDDETCDLDAALAQTFDQAQDYVTKLLTDAETANGAKPVEKHEGTAKMNTKKDGALVKLYKLAVKEMARDKGLTFARAFTKIYRDPANRALAVAEKTERRGHMQKASGVPNDNGEDDDGLLALFERYGLTPDPQLVSEIRNWSMATASAPPTRGVGKSAARVQADARSRLEAIAASLTRSSAGLDHRSALIRAGRSNPELLAASGFKSPEELAA
jgi:hypothetical protein